VSAAVVAAAVAAAVAVAAVVDFAAAVVCFVWYGERINEACFFPGASLCEAFSDGRVGARPRGADERAARAHDDRTARVEAAHISFLDRSV